MNLPSADEVYLNLIQQLLECPSGEEGNILEANQNLLDETLIQIMLGVAQVAREENQENTADFLENMARGIVQWLNYMNSEDYLNFLQEVLEAEIGSNNNPEWARNVFSQSSPEESNIVAGVIQNLCIDIQQFSLGSRLDNLEIAITGYEAVLEIFTREASPVDWAMTQNNLGTAYSDRIKGEKVENLEKAIAAYENSLEVYTRKAFPVQWATTQNNLGIAYLYRIKGEKAENLEKAIDAYQLSLEVRTREAFPVQWAMTQNNLGIAYLCRIKGEKAENLEKAIAAYQLSLEVLTREAFPVDWAKVELNYGGALYEHFLELRNSRDLDQAIEAYQEVLKVLTVYRSSYDYEEFGKILNGLGKALFQRGSYSEAIFILEQARELWQSKKELPELAVTLYELAKLYHRRGCLERARLYFKDSLRLFRRLDRPDKSATVLTALANLELQGGKIGIAIRHLKEAQEYYQGENNLEKLKEVNDLLSLVPQDFIRKIEVRDVNPQPV